jgi:hypothetical protein
MTMDETTHLNLPIPNADAVPPTNISDEFPRIALAFVMLDLIIHTLQESVAGKAEAEHNHAISAITGLAEALAEKMAADATFSLDDLQDVQGAAAAAVNYVLVKNAEGNWVPSSALAAIGEHDHSIEQVVGLAEALIDFAEALAALASGKADLLSDGASDDAFSDTSEIGYVDGTTQKRGTLLGLITSIFNGTREIANGIFEAASFAWQNAGGFKRTHNIAGHTGNRATNWPDGPVTIPAGTLAKEWIELPRVTLTGGAVDWTGIPAGVSEIELWLDEASVTSTQHMALQIGSGGVPAASGYLSSSAYAGASSRDTSDLGFISFSDSAAYVWTGVFSLRRMQGTNRWFFKGSVGNATTGSAVGIEAIGSGVITLTAAVDNMRLTRETGSQTFDSGYATLRYR